MNDINFKKLTNWITCNNCFDYLGECVIYYSIQFNSIQLWIVAA